MSKKVYAYVIADILHVGHIRFLQEAKALGDHLIVGVLTDSATMEKKPMPVIPFQERVRIIEALRYVDQVVMQEHYSPLENVQKYKPDILVESGSHKEQPANEFVESYGGKVFILPYYQHQSSTKIKNLIRERGV